ncbi:MAG: DUF7309 domain-containing protein [Chloroflexia bacterium]
MVAETPSPEEWRALYAAAMRLYALHPWTWLYEDQILGVVNPENGEVGYCSVMGSLDQHLALAVYLGDEGFDSFLNLRDAEGEWDTVEAFIRQKALQASFESREMLTEEDRQVIRGLGLKFRGRQAWPLFRDHSPGYFPWYLTASQARFLTLALEQTAEVAARFRDNPAEWPTVDAAEDLLVRVPEPGPAGLTWREERRPLPAGIPTPELACSWEADIEETLRRKSPKMKRQGALEIDTFYLPTAVQDQPGERPFHPQMLLAADHGSGFILSQEMISPGMLGDALVKMVQGLLLEGLATWPRQIGVRREELARVLDGLVGPLGIEVLEVEDLPAISLYRQMLAEWSRWGR